MTSNNQKFYSSEFAGIIYNTPEELADWLFRHPQEEQGYVESAYRLAMTFAAWGDFIGMRECLNLMVDVLILLEEKQGRVVLK